MALPTSSNFPDSFDSDDNLFAVQDGLRLRLIEDYEAGDSTIQTEGDPFIIAAMPPKGIITLTEQCSDLDKRAISFYYETFDPLTVVFSDLSILDGFTDVTKLKRVTNVTVNVMAEHHNHLKNALIDIQGFCGIKGTVDKEPFGDTLEGRINFLRNVVLVPKAWFTSDIRTGNIPLEVEFQDMSFRLGTDGDSGEIRLTWDFGDQMTSVISTISATEEVPGGENDVDVIVRDTDGETIKKTYFRPGLYDVKLTVENDFGSDVCIFSEYINAREKAPDEAIVKYVVNTETQDGTAGVPPQGPFDTAPPKIRSPINTLIQIEVQDGGATANDPIEHYTWSLGDDLTHPNSSETKASYSVGGIYDLKLRVDTQFNAYRITTYEDSIDIIENQNLWLWTHQSADTVRSYEYGLISETFKLTPAATLTLDRDESFLDSVPNSEQQKREFNKNTGFAPRTTTTSGRQGIALLYWASGRSAAELPAVEQINVREFNGFSGTYVTRSPISRQWNWANFNSNSKSFFAFGGVDSYPPQTSPTNQFKQTLDFVTLNVTSAELVTDNYLNGANELTQNTSSYDGSGESITGHFSVYRTAWKDNSGYLARNDGVSAFFRIKSFYRTEGTISEPFVNIRKMQDIQGPTKQEGELTTLSAGVYFLNNSGSVSKFDSAESTWSTGGPGVNSLLYRSLQDTSVIGYDDPANTLMVASDGDKRAYMSFDYSSSAFAKFNEIDLTFTALGSRPDGDQWLLGVY